MLSIVNYKRSNRVNCGCGGVEQRCFKCVCFTVRRKGRTDRFFRTFSEWLYYLRLCLITPVIKIRTLELLELLYAAHVLEKLGSS
jgi:hypothetical protein